MSHLIEPELKMLFARNLNECKETKLRYYSWVLNISLFFGFTISVAVFLYFRYKGRMTDEAKKARNAEDRLYILNKLKMVHDGRYQDTNRLIRPL